MDEHDVEELYLDDQSLDDYLEHYGTPRHSGRYPWGSGEDPYQHTGDIISRIEELKAQGYKTDKEIADVMGISTTQLRAERGIALSERKKLLVAEAKSLKKDGLSNAKIAEKLGLPGESSVRSILNADSETRMKLSEKTAMNLKSLVDERGMIDVGSGTEKQLGISKEKMTQALIILKDQGYEVYGGRVEQQTNVGKFTTLKVLCPPGTPKSAIYQYDKINSITDLTSRDDGDTFEPSFVYPASMDSNRLAIRYAEDGGVEKDGVLEIRRGVPDLNLGSNYAQVRILVDGTHYIKGMAVYGDDLPEGTDIIFNTNKSKSVSKMDVLKEIKDDPENPFGSYIKENGGQSYYIDENGEKKLSLINKRADEGDWGDWSKELSSQFLSKQPLSLIKKQITLSETDKQAEFDEIMSLTNPTVKKAMLDSFANDCDAASVHLKAASLPGTVYKVILPITSLKDTECYNPSLEEGTQVALIRYPHAGTFEIPILTVNNRNPEARNVLTSTPSDAIGINSKVAARLSGADFDGDTVMVIPLRAGVKVSSAPPLEGLVGFDPTLSYQYSEKKEINGVTHYYRDGHEFKIMSEAYKQKQMGIVSNLITDMTLKGATDEEKARAVRHSMVVIDAVKHKLDYRQSEIDNGIQELKDKYQGKIDPETGRTKYGASTLISASKSSVEIPERKEGAFFTKDTNQRVEIYDLNSEKYINTTTGEILNRNAVRKLYSDPNTGEKVYTDTGREYKKVTYKDSKGKLVTAPTIEKNGLLYYKDETGKYVPAKEDAEIQVFKATQGSTRMAEAKDARILSTGTPQEELYAEYANKLKSLANQARKESFATKEIAYSPSARIVYQEEVDSLDYKLNQSILNDPKERRAQGLAAIAVRARLQGNENLTNEQKSKIRQQELVKARAKVGAKRVEVVITDKEWEAIQAGAISKTKLADIVKRADSKRLRELSMPRQTTELSPIKISRIKNMAASGYTLAEIANSLGVSVSTVDKYMKGKEE